MRSETTYRVAADTAWDLFESLVLAGHRRDAGAVERSAREAGRQIKLVEQIASLIGIHVILILVKEALGHQEVTDRAELVRAAGRVGPAVRETIVLTDEQITEVLLAVYNLHPNPKSLSRGQFYIWGAVIGGCLHSDPERVLAEKKADAIAFAISTVAAQS